jgi:hypothetical protein
MEVTFHQRLRGRPVHDRSSRPGLEPEGRKMRYETEGPRYSSRVLSLSSHRPLTHAWNL